MRATVQKAESEITRIQAIIDKIDSALALPDLFSREPDKAAQLSKARAAANDALAKAEEDWLSASSALEDAARAEQAV